MLTRGSHDLARTAGANDRYTTIDTTRAIHPEGDGEGRRKGASGDDGQKQRGFKHEIPNELIRKDLAAPLAK
jgi:hypothetical protein